MTRVYKTFNYPNAKEGSKTLLTGIVKKDDKYLISGFYEEGDKTVSFLWKGRILDSKKGKWYIKNFHSQTTNLYGPNFSDCENIQVVGNYFQNGSLGCLYEGPLRNSKKEEKGKWTIVIPPFHSNVVNTILHSVRENLAVGNYEIANENVSKAFIYNLIDGNYVNIVPDFEVTSISAYGIVFFKGLYTICGGYVRNGKSYGYMVNYDKNSNKFSHWKEFTFNSNLITHFDGISVDEKGNYTLTGDYVGVGETNHFGFLAKYRKDRKEMKWYPIQYPNSIVTSGNSVSKDVVIGVYVSPNSSQVNGFISY